MEKVYEVWCEWDIGHHDKVFRSDESAMDFIREVDWKGMGINSDFDDMEKVDIVDMLLEDDMVGVVTKELRS